MIPFTLDIDNKTKIINLCAKLRTRIASKIADAEDLVDICKVLEFFEEQLEELDSFRAEISSLNDKIDGMETDHDMEVETLNDENNALTDEIEALKEKIEELEADKNP